MASNLFTKRSIIVLYQILYDLVKNTTKISNVSFDLPFSMLIATFPLIVFSFLPISQEGIGYLRGRSLQRIIGTGVAAIWTYFSLAITYATWDHAVGKWIVAGILSSFWGSFCAVNIIRLGHQQNIWRVAGFTVPLIFLSMLRSPEPRWAETGWRFINVCMGVVIVNIVCYVVFPVSVRSFVKDNFEIAMDNIAGLLRQLPLHVS